METIYDFTDEMMTAHNTLKDARDKFAELVELESRNQSGLPERHRQKWVTRVHDIEKAAPVMVKEKVEGVEGSMLLNEALEEVSGDLPLAYKDMAWQDLRAIAKEKGHKTHGLTRPAVEALLEIDNA